jgi:hypothetical protein
VTVAMVAVSIAIAMCSHTYQASRKIPKGDVTRFKDFSWDWWEPQLNQKKRGEVDVVEMDRECTRHLQDHEEKLRPQFRPGNHTEFQ